MIKAFKYRLYPNTIQQQDFAKHFGCARWVYNFGLEQKNKAYTQEDKKSLSVFDLTKMLVPLKVEFPWLKDVNSQSLQASLRNLDVAFTKFFSKQADFPKFKNKSSKQSFQCPQGVKVDFEHGKISFPKIKDVKIMLHRPFEGKIKTVTVSRTATGKYFASILVDDGDPEPVAIVPDIHQSVGVDLGIKDFAVLSTGEKIANPRLIKTTEKKLGRAQRSLSRKKKGSSNRNKARHKVALIHEKLTNQRKDFQHKLSNRLISENQAICLEDLAVSNLLKNRNLSRHISDVAWGQFRSFCTYKAAWSGKAVKVIGRFEPSSKMCNICGTINRSLKLADRVWTCACGTVHDRDILAAKNILNFAFVK